MKTIIPAFGAVLFLILSSTQVKSQDLTLKDLAFMLNHDIHEDSSYIATKGFTHYATHKTAFCSDMTWVEVIEDTTSGPGTLLFKMSCNGDNHEIGYEFYAQDHMNQLLDDAVAANMVIEIEEERPDGSFYEEYANEDLAAGFLSGTHADGHHYFTVTLMNR